MALRDTFLMKEAQPLPVRAEPLSDDIQRALEILERVGIVEVWRIAQSDAGATFHVEVVGRVFSIDFDQDDRVTGVREDY